MDIYLERKQGLHKIESTHFFGVRFKPFRGGGEEPLGIAPRMQKCHQRNSFLRFLRGDAPQLIATPLPVLRHFGHRHSARQSIQVHFLQHLKKNKSKKELSQNRYTQKTRRRDTKEILKRNIRQCISWRGWAGWLLWPGSDGSFPVPGWKNGQHCGKSFPKCAGSTQIWITFMKVSKKLTLIEPTSLKSRTVAAQMVPPSSRAAFSRSGSVMVSTVRCGSFLSWLVKAMQICPKMQSKTDSATGKISRIFSTALGGNRSPQIRNNRCPIKQTNNRLINYPIKQSIKRSI